MMAAEGRARYASRKTTMICASPKISIRQAVSSDLPQIAEMMRSVSDRDHSIEKVRAMTADLAPGEFYAWLAVADEDPVGLTMVEPCVLEHRGSQTKAGYWRYLWVSPDQRRTGLYPRLVFTTISGAACAGLELVYGGIRRPDVAAGHLALGMQRVGEIPVLAKPLNPASLFTKMHHLGNFLGGLSAVPDFAYRQYLFMRRLSAGSRYAIHDIAATQVDPGAVIPALRDLYASDLQRPLNPQSFLKRYRMNSDGDEYRVLSVGALDEVRAAIVYRTAVRGGNIQALVIMESGYRGIHQDALRFGLMELEKRAIDLRCEVILCLSSAPVIQALLRQSGYIKSNEKYVLMKKATQPQNGGLVPDNLDDWYFTFSDHDAF
jgi:hypothetical protein